MNFSPKPVLLKVPLVEVPLSSFPYSLIGETNKGIKAKWKCVRFLLRMIFEKKERSLHCAKSRRDNNFLTVDIKLRTELDLQNLRLAALQIPRQNTNGIENRQSAFQSGNNKMPNVSEQQYKCRSTVQTPLWKEKILSLRDLIVAWRTASVYRRLVCSH